MMPKKKKKTADPPAKSPPSVPPEWSCCGPAVVGGLFPQLRSVPPKKVADTVLAHDVPSNSTLLPVNSFSASTNSHATGSLNAGLQQLGIVNCRGLSARHGIDPFWSRSPVQSTKPFWWRRTSAKSYGRKSPVRQFHHIFHSSRPDWKGKIAKMLGFCLF